MSKRRVKWCVKRASSSAIKHTLTNRKNRYKKGKKNIVEKPVEYLRKRMKMATENARRDWV
jgi:hypothetical protein